MINYINLFVKIVIQKPYDSFSLSVMSSTAVKSSEAEFMQYLLPVGPSSKTWPRCTSSALHTTSVLTIPNRVSSRSIIGAPGKGLLKLGQPVPDSNLSLELNRGTPEAMLLYMPGLWLSQ